MFRPSAGTQHLSQCKEGEKKKKKNYARQGFPKLLKEQEVLEAGIPALGWKARESWGFPFLSSPSRSH